jgi:hypothetical protein
MSHLSPYLRLRRPQMQHQLRYASQVTVLQDRLGALTQIYFQC